MRRLAVCAFVVLAIGLVLAPGALASTGPRHAVPGARHAALGARQAAAAGVNFQRLGDTTYSISGHVLDYDGNPVAGAEVDWGWWDDNNNYNFGGSNFSTPTSTGTDSSGAFSFPGVAGGAPNGDDLTVYYYNQGSPGLWIMDSWKLDFSTQSTFEMQPAHVNVNIANAPASEPVAEVKVGLMNLGYAITDVPGGVGAAGVLPTSFDDVVAYYPYYATKQSPPSVLAETESLGSSPVTVDPGKTATDTVNLYWNNAQYAHLAGPTCRHSGKPGTKVNVVLKGWPVGEQARFVAYYSAGGWLYASLVNSTGAGNTYTAPLQIRSNAAVDLYEIDTYRTDAADSFVDLWDWFQVCTFKASASAIHHGGAVRLSGKVPGTGRVTLYSTTHKVSSQPSTLAAKGWHKVGTYKTSSRKFATGLLHPTRTTSYVVKYSGYAFPAFTSLVKVTVR